VPEKLHFMKEAPLTADGWVTLPDRPGFGIELDAAKIERQEALTSL
jgi:L-alanine-DL-glutamate epimerase-like enolase superfamily enzyme